MADKKTYALLFLLSFLLSCTSSTVPLKTEATKGTPSSRIEAAKFEEVELITTKGDSYKGKVLSLEGENIEFLPFPYWNVDRLTLNLDEIHSIKLVKKRSGIGTGLLSGFAWPFIIIGTIGGAGSRYNEDYEESLFVSTIIGGAGGLLGLVIGAIADIGTKTKYEFTRMTRQEKEHAVREIMGLRPK